MSESLRKTGEESNPAVIAVCLSATIQKTVTFNSLEFETVNRSDHYLLHASGKAINTARVLNQLKNGFCEVVCPIGKENSTQFLELSHQTSFPIRTIEIPGKTRECLTLLNKEKTTTTELVIDEAPVKTDMSGYMQKLLDAISDSLDKDGIKALILAGSRPKIWSEDLSAKICKLAYDKQKIVMCDFWGDDLKRTLKLCTPHIIKINEEEFCKTFGYDFPQKEDELAKLISLESKKLNNIIVITRGSKATIAGNAGTIFTEEIKKVNAINTIGCGDSFSAGFLFEYINALPDNCDADTSCSAGTICKALKTGTDCAARNAANEAPGSIKQCEINSVKIRNSQIQYAKFGRGKKTFVLLPGLYTKSLMPLAESVADYYKSFTDEYTVYMFDRILEAEKGYTVLEMAHDTIKALDELGLSKTCLTGISAGGMIAQIIAGERGDLVEKLILGSTTSKMTEDSLKVIKNWAELAQNGKADELNQAFAQDVYSTGFYEKYKDAILASLQGATKSDLQRFTIFAQALLKFDSTPLLKNITCPVLVLGAEDDKVLGCKASSILAEKTGGLLYIYKDYGHAVYDEASDYLERIGKFLTCDKL